MIKNFLHFITESKFIIKKDDAGRSKSNWPTSKNDCSVRVTCLAFNLNYDEVYNYFKEIGPIRGGFSDSEILLVWKKLGKSHEKIRPSKEMLLSDFLKKYPKGSYVLSYRNHVTNVIDGVLYEIDKPLEYFQKEIIHKIYKIR
jgi:RNA recognition motif-containing protein